MELVRDATRFIKVINYSRISVKIVSNSDRTRVNPRKREMIRNEDIYIYNVIW